ncbi:MAG TPA: hypothetical protein VIM13_06875 [Clostridia bacterium]
MIDKRKAAGIILAGALVFTGTVSLAANEPAQQTPPCKAENVPVSPVTREQVKERINNALDKLVDDKVITQEQKDAVLKAMEARRPCKVKERDGKPGDKGGKPGDKRLRCSKHGVLQDLVKDGTITQEQADAIREAIRSVYKSIKKPE